MPARPPVGAGLVPARGETTNALGDNEASANVIESNEYAGGHESRPYETMAARRF